MANANPSVSVFHFTSRISSAKIRKYKLATERGMNGGNLNAIPPSNHPADTPPATTESPTMEPPAKRPKLKLSVRPPSASPDTIAVSRPKRESALRIRYSENMIIDAADVDDIVMGDDPKPSPPASSDPSSRESVVPVEKEPRPTKAPDPAPAKKRDYGLDFMSYYVADGDEEDDKQEESEPEVQPLPQKPDPPKQAPVPAVPDKPPRQTYFEHHVQQPPSYPRPKLQPPQPSFAQPTVHLIDTTRKATKSKEPDTVAQMISKLENLSAALTTFGGVPPMPKTPTKEESENVSAPQPASEKKDVDNFLAMFDDDDDDDDDEDDSDEKDETSDKESNPLDRTLQNPGEPDGALTYGIQFIQNALRSWAQQRLTSQYAQHYMSYQQQARDVSQPQKRGPGRPRKFELGDEDHQSVPPPPLNIQFDLAKTPEGAAIAAFQDVLDSGCLRVNAMLPLPLTRALRHLYMQIDHLINQGSRADPPWQCMSYCAQISAQKIRVEAWKEAHAKAQEEMARQQYLANQHVMQQMGLKPTHRSNSHAEQSQAEHAIALERKRSLQHAAQQPHLTKYLTNPLNLNEPHGSGQAGSPASASSHPIPSASSPGLNHANGMQNLSTSHSSPVEGKMNHLDRIKMYGVPGFLPRSGQSMKFSFAPTSELALKAFGPQAFPANHTGPNMPNRGPMAANPYMSNSHAYTRNGSLPATGSHAHAAPPMAAEQSEGHCGGVDVVAKDVEMTDASTPRANGASAHSSPKLTNGGVSLAARFPHPGAVVVDQ